tara:strand:- start:1175 stop:2917 length:1743 start_codon:yes stop_codon:yes gene_type:complete
MELVFDIEANELLEKATTIWCIVAIDEQDKVYSFKPDEIDEGIELLKKADKLIGHNILGYDLPLIKKLKGVDLYDSNKVIDTLVLSRLLNPSREGGHSIEKWGYRLGGVQKQKHEDWTQFSPAMLSRCVTDTQINKKLFNYLKKESFGFSKQSINIEHNITYLLEQQKETGFLFNEKNAMLLTSELSSKLKETEDKVHETFKPIWIDDKKVIPKLKKDGKLSKQGLTEQEYLDIIEQRLEFKPFMRKTLQEFNLGSRLQIGQRLLELGWKPNNFTPTGRPIVDESTLKKIEHIPEAKLIADFLLYQKRLAQVHSWIDAVKKDGRVHGSVISTGAITGRMAHRDPNMAQVPAVYSPYGKECRGCWIVPEGYKLVGIDASGLELRLLAHYMADEEYTNEILNGDIHTANQKLAGLKSRDEAKTFIYALIYGAGDAKIGSITKGSRAEGKRLRERFLSSLPAFQALKSRVDRASEKGYLKGLDGRKIILRHRHAALNSLLQGGGAIAMKKAMLILQELIDLNTIDAKFVANIHDEWQIQVKEEQSEFVGELGVQAIEQAGQHFNMRCPLTGEYKIGDSWNETH